MIAKLLLIEDYLFIMDPSHEVCKSLIKWFQTLKTDRARSVTEISDGVAIVNVLIQISPEHFEKLRPKIKVDVGSHWMLKESNLKKINECILEYYQDVLNLQILDIGRPDVTKLAKTSDLIQLGKLLRLILGCAINCERQQEYITQIMSLEESVQQCIMLAIQQLEEVTGGQGRSGISLLGLDTDSKVLRLVGELDAANEAKEMLAQQCHNLEHQVQSLQEEKQALLSENQVLATQLNEKQMLDITRSPDKRRQVELLKEELFKVETIRDDYRAKILDQEKQISGLQEKVAELQLATEATNRLKDEVDALSETADKVQTLEIAIASYKKKLEDYTDIKKQLKTLEDKNVEYLQLNLKYEDELKKHSVWKSQMELYKNQVAELQQKLDEQMQKSDKAVFMSKNLESKYEAALAEKDRIAKERDSLREENEELKLGQPKGERGAAMAQELIPTEMKERLRFLEKENTTLRANNQDATAKQAMLDDALNRLKKLTETNRNCHQKILELEAQLEDQQKPREHAAVSLKEYEQKISTLQEALSTKESELQNVQAKYSRNLEKAREVAMNLDLRSNGSIESIRSNNMKELEEKLITSAFYRLTSTCHREAVDERLALLSAGQGQSFLSRQRQPTPRKQVIPFKSKDKEMRNPLMRRKRSKSLSSMNIFRPSYKYKKNVVKLKSMTFKCGTGNKKIPRDPILMEKCPHVLSDSNCVKSENVKCKFYSQCSQLQDQDFRLKVRACEHLCLANANDGMQDYSLSSFQRVCIQNTGSNQQVENNNINKSYLHQPKLSVQTPCDVAIDKLPSYFKKFVYVSKKMSSMAEMIDI